MYGTSDFKKGLKILINDQPFTIVDFQHVKPGKGNQFTRTKLKNLITGSNMDLTIRSGEKFKVPDIHYTKMTFLYKEGDEYNFMDSSTYAQTTVHKNIVGDSARFLHPDLAVTICIYKDAVVNIDLPKSVELKIEQTDPGFKGNTVSNTFKSATMETGYCLQVPLHINIKDTIRINTEDGTYIERVRIKE